MSSKEGKSWHVMESVFAMVVGKAKPHSSFWRIWGVDAADATNGSESACEDFQSKWNHAVEDLINKVPTFFVKQCEPSFTRERLAADETSLHHIPQRSTWDCGVTCLQMVLLWLRDENSTQLDVSTIDQDREWLEQQIATESVWSIDLVFCLINLYQNRRLSEKMASLRVLFVSRSLSVNDEHSELGYYRDAFDLDQVRVKSRFKQVSEFQASNEDSRITVITLECGSGARVTMEELSRVVAMHNCIAIILLDNTVLKSRVHGEIDKSNGTNYEGHYIVLKGVYRERETLFFVAENPSSLESPTIISSIVLEEAWRTKGTDEDLVLLCKH